LLGRLCQSVPLLCLQVDVLLDFSAYPVGVKFPCIDAVVIDVPPITRIVFLGREAQQVGGIVLDERYPLAGVLRP
jgi:hypothetical protein